MYLYLMSCRTIQATMLPIKSHEIKLYEQEEYKVEQEIKPEYSLEYETGKNFSFWYCVSYRHPSLSEWILARWYWNDEWIWTPDGLWND